MLKPGELLAQRYELKEKVGRGGFATVYRATDQLFNRDVAIKLVELDDTPSEQVSDLLAEARFVASQRHPHILDVYDFGQEGSNTYLVLPFATGGSFATFLRRHPRLSPNETLHFLEQIAGGLDHAHSLGVVHRDIKPANILLFEPKPYQAVISDFGLAKIIEEGSTKHSSTQVSGTPSYMSPEQIQGKPTKATDIYALGVMLFQMLTGELPYKGEPTAVMYAHIHSPVPLAHEFVPEISPALSSIVARAMSKQPEARYSRAQDIYADFKRTLDNSATELTMPISSTPNSNLAAFSNSTQVAVPNEQAPTISLESAQTAEPPKKKSRFQFKLNFSINIAISIGALAFCVVAALLVLNPQNNVSNDPITGQNPSAGVAVGSAATTPTIASAVTTAAASSNTMAAATTAATRVATTAAATTAASSNTGAPGPGLTVGGLPTAPVTLASGHTGSGSATATINTGNLRWILDDAWNSYKNEFMQPDGRVIDPAGDISTSEGQSYAMLRALWSNDRATFDRAFSWAQNNLSSVRGDKLFAFKWGKNSAGEWGVLDKSNATDADVDIALALILAAKQWNEPKYKTQAQELLKDLWEKNIVKVRGKPFLAAGDWAATKLRVVLNVSYFAPYAFRIFSTVDTDTSHDWKALVDTSYEAIRACSELDLGGLKAAKLPANWCAVDKTDNVYSAADDPALDTNYGYDAFRTYWRVALDYRWFKDKRALDYLTDSATLRQKYRQDGQISPIYSYDGKVIQKDESLATYAGFVANLIFTDPATAKAVIDSKFVNGFYKGAKPDAPNVSIAAWRSFDNYYTQNWAWFTVALYADLLPNLS